MQTTQKRAGGDGFGNVCNRGVRVIRGRNVIEGQKNPGDYLGNENKQESGAENVTETRATGDGFVESCAEKSVHAGTVGNPSPYTRLGRSWTLAFPFRGRGHPRANPSSADDFLVRHKLPKILESHEQLAVLN